MMKYYFFTLVALFLSCGKQKEETNQEKPEEPKAFEMIVECKYDFDDEFKVYYTNDLSKPIDGSLILVNKVYGNKDFQKIVFTFPLGGNPKSIRLDTGINQKSDTIEIKGITIMQGDSVIDNSDWTNTLNWSPNECLIQDLNNKNVYKIVPNKDGIKAPTFMSNIFLTEKLSK